MQNKFTFLENHIDPDFELEIYKKKINQDYSKINYKFSMTGVISPTKLEHYKKEHLYSKLYRNDEQRKSLQVKGSTISTKTVNNFKDNKGRFINNSYGKVYNLIKGKNYILQLGQMPFSTRARNLSNDQSCQTYVAKSRCCTERPKTSHSTCSNRIADRIQENCKRYSAEQGQIRKLMNSLEEWNNRQYKIGFKRPKSCTQQRERRNNNAFKNQFTENIFRLSATFQD